MMFSVSTKMLMLDFFLSDNQTNIICFLPGQAVLLSSERPQHYSALLWSRLNAGSTRLMSGGADRVQF